MTYNDYIYKILCELSKENNFTVKGFSQNYIIEVKNKTNKKFYIYGNCFPLNNSTTQKLCADKSALSDVLKLNNIPCLPHKLYKNPNYDKSFDIKNLQNELKLNKNGLVIKDNKGFCGNNVFWVKNKKQLKYAVKEIFKQNLDLAVSPYINFQEEYRLVMLNNECKICYKKVRPFVIGNQKQKIKDLIKQKYGDTKFDLPFKLLNKVPDKNEKIVIGWKHNLKLNSTPEQVNDKKLKAKLVSFAKKVVETINLNFCSVDLFLDDNQIKVLEINSIVSMNTFANYTKQNYNITKELFLEAVKSSFDKV